MSAVFAANTHTVKLTLCVPTPLLGGNGWTWGPHPEAYELGRDFTYNRAELIRVFRVWGAIIARTVVGDRWDAFTVSAHGTVCGSLLGRDTWTRDRHTGLLEPHGEPVTLTEHAALPSDMGPMCPR